MDLVVRFFAGGVIVSIFAVAGELFKPKTFSGLFGAAPSVSIASLALAYWQNGVGDVTVEARSMIIGALAMIVYCVCCVLLTRRERLPVWLGAGVAWASWFAVALTAFHFLRGLRDAT